MGKKLSCGVLIFNKRKELFLCRATGLGKWDLPKGMPDAGESYIAAAKRELKEETGFEVSIDDLVDMGRHKYSLNKDLYLFAYNGDIEFDPAAAVCSSFFEHPYSGKNIPEVDSFRFMPKDEVMKNVVPNMWAVLEKFFVKMTGE